VLPGGPNVLAAEATVKLCQQHVQQHAALVQATTNELYEAGKLLEAFQNSRALEEAQTAYRNCPEADTCFVCGQTKPHPVREQLRATLTAVTKERDAIQDQLSTLQRRLHLDRNAKSIADSELQTAIAKYEVAQTSEYALNQHEESLYMDAVAYIEAAEKLTEHDKEYEVLSNSLEVLKLAKQAVERARVQYMLDYAVRIGSLANQYLQLIGAKHSIEMVLEKGKLEILVSGTGATSYSDCSSGEQRRIDICLLLAMSQVAANSGNITPNTPMIIDEALDTLDSDGVDALLLLACQIGQTRQVILVSHAAHPLPQGSEIQTLQL
jgi:DNA repair exonuclease SbcCD ATPase subunit